MFQPASYKSLSERVLLYMDVLKKQRKKKRISDNKGFDAVTWAWNLDAKFDRISFSSLGKTVLKGNAQ